MSRFSNLGVAPSQVEDVFVEFGEWRPDMDELNNPGAMEALNVIAKNGGYIPFRDLLTFAGTTLTQTVTGGLTVYSPNPLTGGIVQPFTFVGGNDGIYWFNYDFMAKQFNTTQVLNLAPGDNVDNYYPWCFRQFGKFLVATHPEADTVYLDLTGMPALSTFNTLPGQPPRALCAGRIGEFLFLGNLRNDDPTAMPPGGDQAERIRWSAFDNIFLPWITDAGQQSDFQDLPAEYGGVMAITGREFGSIFQERAIHRVTYRGLPTVHDIDLVETERGALSPGAVVDLGSLVYFVAEDGFYVWDGTSTTPIGDKKVNDYFRSKLHHRGRFRISSAIDKANEVIAWAIPVLGDNTDEFDESFYLREIFMYSYREQKFTHGNHVVQCIFNFVHPDPDVPSIDLDPNPVLGDNVDTETVPFDSPFNGSQRSFLGAINEFGRLGAFVGVAKEAVFDTLESTAPNGKRVMISSVTPTVDVDVPACRVQIHTRDQLLGEWLGSDSYTVQEPTGEVPSLAEGRYVRVRVRIPRGTYWSFASGVNVSRKVLGKA